jgi:hypothetical protein
MIEKITPMKRLKGQFSELTSFLSKDFELVTLNEHDPKNIPHPFQPIDETTGHYKSSTKGVVEEHIRKYEDKNSDISLAFIFEYKNKKIEDWKIFASIKTTKDNDSIIYSLPYNFNDFKNNLNNVLSIIRQRSSSKKKNEVLSTAFVFNTFSNQFLQNKFDFDKEFIKSENIVNKAVEKSSSILDAHLESVLIAENEVLNVNNIVKKSISKTSEFKEFNMLEKRMKILKKELDQKQKTIEDKNNLTEKQESVEELNKLTYSLKRNVKKESEEIKKILPKMVAKKLK